MRITGGMAAGLTVEVPRGLDVRPTPDKVRQAIFNSLGERVVGARVLELFAGSGALSLESLSRGAVSALCIEKSARHGQFIRDNFRAGPFGAGQWSVRIQDAFAAVSQLAAQGALFDLVLADPPYGEKNIERRSTSLAQRVLDDPLLPRLLGGAGWLVLGHTKRDTLAVPDGWTDVKRLPHGDTIIRFFQPGQPTQDDEKRKEPDGTE